MPPDLTERQSCVFTPRHYADAIEAAAPARGRVHLDEDTVMSAQSFGGHRALCGCRSGGSRRGLAGRREKCLCCFASSRPSCRDRLADGVLLLQQCGDRGTPRASRAWCERVAIVDFDVHHGNGTRKFLVRPFGALRFDASNAAVSRHRRSRRVRRARQYRQRAAQGGQ